MHGILVSELQPQRYHNLIQAAKVLSGFIRIIDITPVSKLKKNASFNAVVELSVATLFTALDITCGIKTSVNSDRFSVKLIKHLHPNCNKQSSISVINTC